MHRYELPLAEQIVAACLYISLIFFQSDCDALGKRVLEQAAAEFSKSQLPLTS
jgi:hypothetical protein